MDKTEIAQRMKAYEMVMTSECLPEQTAVCVRLDGRSFSRFTKGLDRPFDLDMAMCMINTTKGLVHEFGAHIGYTQSDEISLIFYWDRKENIIFGGKYHKLISNITSMCTVLFYKEVIKNLECKTHCSPTFDCRIWTVPDITEACNYLIWRELDAKKNSVSMFAHSLYSTKELYKKGQADQLEMIREKGFCWENSLPHFKFGSYLQRETYMKPTKREDGTIEHVQRSRVERVDIDQLLNVTNREMVVFRDMFTH